MHTHSLTIWLTTVRTAMQLCRGVKELSLFICPPHQPAPAGSATWKLWPSLTPSGTVRSYEAPLCITWIGQGWGWGWGLGLGLVSDVEATVGVLSVAGLGVITR